MQITILLAVLAVLVWIIMTVGIEAALVLATALSGVVWLLDRFWLRKARPSEVHEPLTIEYARSFFPIFLIVLLLRSFLVEPFRIPSGSMMPTLLVGDFILVNKFAFGLRLPVTKTKILENGAPERGDVVVFRFPRNPRTDYIKRVVALPGDKVSYKNKTLHINGEPMPVATVGPYQPVGSGMRATGSIEGVEHLGNLEHSILVNPFVPDFSRNCTFLGHKEVTVPADNFFVMGDNRDDSNDGRCWGFVPEQNLVGKAFVIWLSWDWQRPGFMAWNRLGDKIE
jgi:signal peptidase I